MENHEEFQGILKNITAKDLQDMLNSVPDADEERKEIITSDTVSSELWGSSGSLKYRRDY